MNTEDSVKITQEELNRSIETIRKLWNYYGEKIVGQKSLGLSLIISLIANGHILLESVPGLAKTAAAHVQYILKARKL